MSRRTILFAALMVMGLGGYWVYESYQEQQRMEALEELFNDESCDTCAARKSSLAKIQADRKAKEAENQAQAED